MPSSLALRPVSPLASKIPLPVGSSLRQFPGGEVTQSESLTRSRRGIQPPSSQLTSSLADTQAFSTRHEQNMAHQEASEDAPGFPFYTWRPSTQGWEPINTLPTKTRDAIIANFHSVYTKATVKVRKERYIRMTSDDKIAKYLDDGKCLGHKVITLKKDDPTPANHTACSKCGENGRVCAQLIKIEIQPAVGLLPLPEVIAEGEESDFSFWHRPKSSRSKQ